MAKVPNRGGMHEALLPGPSFGATGPSARAEEVQAWSEGAEAGLPVRHV